MDSPAKPNSEGVPTASLDFANLWEEYRYRHDLIWRLLFRITFVAVVLTITPFTINDSIRNRVGGWLILLPALAILLAFGSWRLLVIEFRLFEPIDNLYRWFRARAVKELRPPDDLATALAFGPKEHDFFRTIVYAYPGLLILLIGSAFAAFVFTS
jgi:hypothetical protein